MAEALNKIEYHQTLASLDVHVVCSCGQTLIDIHVVGPEAQRANSPEELQKAMATFLEHRRTAHPELQEAG